MPEAASQPSQQTEPWIDALHDYTDAAFEYCRDVIDVRNVADLLDINAYYLGRQQKWLVAQWTSTNHAMARSWSALMSGGPAIPSPSAAKN